MVKVKGKKILSWIITLTLILFNFSGVIGTQVVKAAVGTGTVDSPYTVAQAYAIQDNSIATVQGYIVGQPTSATTVLTVATADTAIAIADTAGETDVTKMIFVQLLTTPAYVRADFGLSTNPTKVGTLVKVTGGLMNYFTTHPGLKNTTAIEAVAGNATATGVTLDKDTLALGVGQTSPLVATVAPTDAANKNVTWSSDNTAVATISTSGVITAVTTGTANILATTVDGNIKSSLCVVTVTANAPPTNKTFDIVEITDFHGQLLDSTNTKPVGAALAKVVKDVKTSNPDRTLVIGGGDLYQGTPVSNVLHGVPVQQVMSNLGMEVTTLGNHEFDWGLDIINNETMKDAKYSIVCANMYNKGTNVRPYAPYKIIVKDGVKIAVIGAILKDAPTIIMPALVAPFDFRDPATEINAVAKEIRDGNLADIVLADVHDGGSSLNSIVKNLSGVDAVFGGHDHTAADTVNVDATGKNVPTLDAASTGKGYIDLKVTVDPTNKIVGFSAKGTNWNALTVTTTSATDPECKVIVDEAAAELLPVFNEVIGNDAVAYTSGQVDSPYGESQLGNWMADVVKNYKTSPTDSTADVGMVNNGGIRLSPIAAGDITVGTIFNIMPFDNTVCTTTMTGAQLKNIFEQAVQTSGKGIQISGVKFTYDSSKPSYKPAVVATDGTITTPEVLGQRVTGIYRESDNSVVNDTDILKVNAPDFVATGGDTFTGFLVPAIVASLVDSHYTVRDALNADVRLNHKLTVNMNNRVDNQMVVQDPVVMSIAEARTTVKTAVILTGYVSAVNGKNVFIQDNAASPTAGICVYNTAGTTFTAKKGDKITVTGNLSVYSGLLEVTPTSAAGVVSVSTGNIVTPKEVTVGAITNALQGQLIKIKNVTFTSIDNAGASMAQDSTGSINVYLMPVVAGLVAGDKADVIAAVTCYGATIELAVDSAADVVKVVVPPTAATKISIIGTSDIHGAIFPLDYNTGLAANVGLAKVSTYVNSVRATNPNTMLIDNGDTIQGTPLSYFYDMIDKTAEYPMMKVMGAMKYDAWTLGNHEFNYGLDTLNRIIGDATKENIAVMSANTYKSDNSNLVQPYIIKSFVVNGKTIKVGVLGLTTKTIPSWEDPAHYADLHFNDLVLEAQKWVPIMKAAGADVVIASIHSGIATASDTIPENQADAVAKQVSGIDAILCGHAHTGKTYSYTNPDGKVVPVVEPKNGDGIFSQIDLNIDADGNFTGVTAFNVTLPASTVADPAILAIAQPYQDATLAYTNTVIGQSTAVFEGAKQLIQPSSIMELVNKVQANAAQATLSIAAPLSPTAKVPQGDVKRQDIMGVYVYENFLYGLKMTGSQLKNWLEWSVRYYKQTTSATDPIVKDSVLNIADYNLDQLYGATYDIDLTQPACTIDSTGKVITGNRIKNLKINGVLVKDTDALKVAVNNYRYNGGGGFMAAAGFVPGSQATIDATFYDSAKALGDDGQVRNMMFKYVQDNGTISPTNSNNWKISTTAVSVETPIDTTPPLTPAEIIINNIKNATIGSTIKCDLTVNPVVSKDIFNAIKGEDKNITFEKTGISWAFNGKDITSVITSDINFSLKAVQDAVKVKEVAKVKKMTGKDELLIPFSFNYDGKLPGIATVKIYVNKDWAGKSVTVCRYFEDKNAYETITKAVVDADGNITIKLDHCSDYFVTQATTLPQIDFDVIANGSVLIGTKAFTLVYANDPLHVEEIISAIVEGGAIYVKNLLGTWIDDLTGLPAMPM